MRRAENGPPLAGAPLRPTRCRARAADSADRPGQLAIGARHLLDARECTCAAMSCERGRLFPADALRGGEQGRQIAPQLIGHRHRGALVRRHALEWSRQVPTARSCPTSSWLSARKAAATASSQFLGAPEASSSRSSRPGRRNNCRDRSRTCLRAFSLGTLPDRLNALEPRSATNTKGSAIGGLIRSRRRRQAGRQRSGQRLLHLDIIGGAARFAVHLEGDIEKPRRAALQMRQLLQPEADRAEPLVLGRRAASTTLSRSST